MSTLVNEFGLNISEDGTIATCQFPGISYDDYDREGGISPWKICKMFEAGRIVAFFQGNFLNMTDLRDKSHSFYVLGGNYYFDSCLWEVTRRYHYFPYKIQSELIDVGQTSMTLRQIMMNTLDEKEVATYYVKYVYVDTSIKRPTPLPYWFRMKYRKSESDEKVRIHASSNHVPVKAFKHPALIAASDTDFNKHTNQAAYVRLCLDAASSAQKAKCFRRLDHDICLYPILKMSVAYHKETVPDDNVVISVWQDDLSPEMLNFSITKDKTVVFTSTMNFKEKPSSKL